MNTKNESYLTAKNYQKIFQKISKKNSKTFEISDFQKWIGKAGIRKSYNDFYIRPC